MNLKHFKAAEFRQYWQKMDSNFLLAIDATREMSGFTMTVSRHPNAVGRTNTGSWHNYVLHGAVYATDFFVTCNGKPLSREQCLHFKECALKSGIKGIGIYPHWHGQVGTGFHLDARTVLTNMVGRAHDQWGGVLNSSGKQVYTSFEDALRLVK